MAPTTLACRGLPSASGIIELLLKSQASFVQEISPEGLLCVGSVADCPRLSSHPHSCFSLVQKNIAASVDLDNRGSNKCEKSF